MKTIWLVMVVFLLFALAAPATAGVSVVCNGWCCGGSGIRLYQYDVVYTGGATFTDFAVGFPIWFSDDAVLNWLEPVGWSHEIVSGAVYNRSSYAPHGQISPGPDDCSPYYIRWWGPAISSGSFGHNFCPLSGGMCDSGWSVGASSEDWSAPVGMGAGPVHAPTIPEPSSLLALGSGLIGLAGVVWRRRIA